MTEQDHLWLEARAYIATRNNYVTSHIAPVYEALAAVLSEAAGFDVHAATDEDIVNHFRPQDEPVKPTKSKKAKEE